MDPVALFGKTVAERFTTGSGQPEELLRGPLEKLLGDLADAGSIAPLVLAGEHQLAEDRVRPDYAVHVGGALVGFVEVKAPGKGANTTRYKAHDREQWKRLACLPNVLYTDGQEFALYRDGELQGQIVRLQGEITTAGEALTAPAELGAQVEEFLRWTPIPPRNPRELARVTARLCQVLRAEVAESLASGVLGLKDLARDWRKLLYPDATDAEFADGYAQTVTFALLLARVEGIDLSKDLRDVADELGARHTLMGRALAVLTDPAVLPKLAVSVETLRRVLAVVDWPKLSKADPAAWLFFYEDFLEDYDPRLRRKTGSYYTPVEVVDPMVRLVDGLLRDRLGHAAGFGSAGVTTIDPAAGTGTFLFRIVERIANTIEQDQGPGAVGPALRAAAQRLVGFELQAGPYSVAELRLATEFHRRGAKLGVDDLRLHLTDTLTDPYVEDTQLAATYRPIAVSRQRANEVKRTERIVVVIGNPPYRERSRKLGGWIESGTPDTQAPLHDFMPPPELGLGAHVKHLYNLYIYFWRWAMWKVFENHPADRGVIAFVSVSGFLHGPGFAEMRSEMRREADLIWVIDCSPEGHQPEVATRIFRGVQQPICVTIALRDGSTGPDEPAPVRFRSIAGTQGEKFEALGAIELAGAGWSECPTPWHAPFLPGAAAAWSAMPALEDLLSWSGSGTMPGRTWVVDPSPSVLRERWGRLVSAPKGEKSELLSEHKQDRTIHTRLSDNLPGYPIVGTIADETGECPDPVRYAVRTLDRAWIIPDKRLINRPNPRLWQVRPAPGQVFLTGLSAVAPSSGPAVTFCSVVPDLDHHHGRGGRVFPLWLDSAGALPNAVPGLLEHLSDAYGATVEGPDLFAYIAGVLSHSGFTGRFADDLRSPGLRVPLTSQADLFNRAVELGRRVLWLHTYGAEFADAGAGRPPGAPRRAAPDRPRVVHPIPDAAKQMPEEIEYDPATQVLSVGEGRIEGVSPAIWEYETSGFRIVRRWFSQRKREPDGRRSSPLDDLVATSWSPEWTAELVDLLHVVGLLTELEPDQAALLNDILEGELLDVEDLKAAGVFPVANRLAAEQPEKQSQLGADVP